jgi:hypothetical protein
MNVKNLATLGSSLIFIRPATVLALSFRREDFVIVKLRRMSRNVAHVWQRRILADQPNTGFLLVCELNLLTRRTTNRALGTEPGFARDVLDPGVPVDAEADDKPARPCRHS